MLTGMDTDRLEEEKRRGLSINLGFAYLKTADNNTAVFIDVPGHNRFINNMIAGIHGIDLGMLVVAADDGPMPQTREHMDVLRLMGVSRFVLVISKIDRVEAEEIELVREESLKLFPEACEVKVFEVDSITGRGIAELAAYLEGEANQQIVKAASGYFRLSIDRVFIMKGSGLVVTGTVSSGRVHSGDTLSLLPQDIPLRIRSIQVQEQMVEQASAGQRCALNISGDIEKEQIERGDWLVETEGQQLTRRFDAEVNLLAHCSFKLKHMSPVKLYIGARRIPARLALLEAKSILPGESALAQLMMENDIHACVGDRFLLRDDSESETLGGGVVLDPHGPVKFRSSPARLQLLQESAGQTPANALGILLNELNQVLRLEQFCRDWNIRSDERSEVLQLEKIKKACKAWEVDGETYLLAAGLWNTLGKWLSAQFAGGDETQGIEQHHLRAALEHDFPGASLEFLLARLQENGDVTLKGSRVFRKAKQASLSEQEAALWESLRTLLVDSGANVPVIVDICKSMNRSSAEINALLKLAVRLHWLFMVAANRPVLAGQLADFGNTALQLAEKDEGFSVADFRKACNIGRNLAVEVLEYFDKLGFTLRKETGRVILDRERVNKLIQQ